MKGPHQTATAWLVLVLTLLFHNPSVVSFRPSVYHPLGHRYSPSQCSEPTTQGPFWTAPTRNSDETRWAHYQRMTLLRHFATRKTSSSNNNNNKGFGSSTSASKRTSSGSSKTSKRKNRLTNALDDDDDDTGKAAQPTIPKQSPESQAPSQEELVAQFQQQAAETVVGKAVTFAKQWHEQQEQANGLIVKNREQDIVVLDPFWELMPSLIQSRFPTVADSELHRIAGLVKHSLCPTLTKPDVEREDCCSDPSLRPVEDIHAYMPDLGPTQPFYDPTSLDISRQFSENYDVILKEYHALLEEMDRTGTDRFQSVTSMNYEAGWRTVVLFYNGHRIPGFPYHVCPTTTQLLESLPLAGRIAGFNRQQPSTGIPRHTDGNNMWLTCQMGLLVPGEQGSEATATVVGSDDQRAAITVGKETRQWKTGECLLYDTTYWHETWNGHPTEERVVLHVDFFNTLALTPNEIEILQYIYSLREQFMKAEGVAKVEQQIL